MIGFDISGFYSKVEEGNDIWLTYGQVGDRKIKISQKRQVSLKDLILHFLLELNEDFDDDLLSDAINLIFASA